MTAGGQLPDQCRDVMFRRQRLVDDEHVFGMLSAVGVQEGAQILVRARRPADHQLVASPVKRALASSSVAGGGVGVKPSSFAVLLPR